MYLSHLMRKHIYYTYILTNRNRTVLYVGVTNNLRRRLAEHYEAWRLKKNSFCARYKVVNLVYWEEYRWVLEAIAREKQLKKWNRTKKEELICRVNPTWQFLNDEFSALI